MDIDHSGRVESVFCVHATDGFLSGGATHSSTKHQQRTESQVINSTISTDICTSQKMLSSQKMLFPVRGEPGYDRLGEVRGILERVQERCQQIYKPHCENSIDDAMIPFQG